MRKLFTASVLASGLALFSLSLVPTPASADVIDFDGLADGDAGNPLVLSGATFTTLGDGFNMVGTERLCAAPTDGSAVAACTNNLRVAFEAPSSDVTFRFCCNDNRTVGADIGDVQVFRGLVLLGTADIVVRDDDAGSSDLVDLSAFGDITRLEISTTDLGGLLYDDFSFTPDERAIAEPATGAIMLVSIGLVAAMRRRCACRS